MYLSPWERGGGGGGCCSRSCHSRLSNGASAPPPPPPHYSVWEGGRTFSSNVSVATFSLFKDELIAKRFSNDSVWDHRKQMICCSGLILHSRLTLQPLHRVPAVRGSTTGAWAGSEQVRGLSTRRSLSLETLETALWTRSAAAIRCNYPNHIVAWSKVVSLIWNICPCFTLKTGCSLRPTTFSDFIIFLDTEFQIWNICSYNNYFLPLSTQLCTYVDACLVLITLSV